MSDTGEMTSAHPLQSVRIVLVEPTHPGNIGAAARAMKAMGLEHLHLVAPTRFPSAEATARAAGADDILHAARVIDSVDEAVADCGFVLGTTARVRHIEWPVIDPREAARRAVDQSARGPVAVLFGRESAGLTNAELDRCQALIRIPATAHFSSLNVAAAVQIVAYELRIEAGGIGVAAAPAQSPAATAGELEGFYRHLEETLVHIGYLDPVAPKLLMRRLRRLFSRAEPDRAEINILRGILTSASRAAIGSSAAKRAPGSGAPQFGDDSAGDDPASDDSASDPGGEKAQGCRR